MQLDAAEHSTTAAALSRGEIPYWLMGAGDRGRSLHQMPLPDASYRSASSSEESYTEDEAQDSEDEAEELVDCKVFRAKCLIDGAASILEMVNKLRAAAADLEELHEHGFELEEKVEGDEAHLVRPADVSSLMDGSVAALN